MDLSNEKDIKNLDNDPGVVEVDPMANHYALETGLEVDPYIALGGKFFERAVKDTPCKFHDGFSGRCWKGTSCPYSHALYSGGKFAKKHPELALATSLRQVATSVHRLPEKIGLNEERQVKCRVTHIVSPDEFFVRPLEEGAPCLCSKVEAHIEMIQQQTMQKEKADVPMDPYFFGHSAMDPAQENNPEENKALNAEDELHSFLSQAFNYTRFQNFEYLSKVELVAAFVNNKWKRAVILYQLEKIDTASLDKPRVLVQLLESGEKLLLPMKQVCRLPEKFAAKPTSAYRCMLWGYSPFFFHWTKRAISLFKEMIEDKVVIITVKISGASTQTFEREPYLVQLRIDNEEGGSGASMDVGLQLYNMGLCLEWNPFPLRPFAAESVDTKSLEAVTDSKPRSLAPSNALELENARLLLQDEENLDDSIDSGTGTESIDYDGTSQYSQ